MGLRLYGFAYCFWNVLRRPAASSVRAAPCQLPRRGSSCTVIWGAGFYRKQFRPFTCGTAHRPFPTVSLVGRRFQPRCSKDGRYGVADCRNVGRNGKTSAPQKLSIVNCQLGQNCPLSTVNCQLKPHPLARLLLMSARASVASGAVVSWVARSLRLRMPQSLPFSRMGRRRICWRPMRWAATPASISGRA